MINRGQARGGPGDGGLRAVRLPAPVGGADAATRPRSTAGSTASHELGVRQLEIINKFDNALTGVAGDDGDAGAVVNGGNFYTTGRFWDLEHCDDPENHDHSPTAVDEPHNDDLIIANGFDAFLPARRRCRSTPSGPHCNTLGLTRAGRARDPRDHRAAR